MFNYTLKLKILNNFDDVENLEPGKKTIFLSLLNMTNALLGAAEEVESSTINSDLTISVVAKEDVGEMLRSKLGTNIEVFEER